MDDATFYAAIAQILPVFVLAIAVQGELTPNFLKLGLRERAARIGGAISTEVNAELDRIGDTEQQATDKFYALDSPSHDEVARFQAAEQKADVARWRLLAKVRTQESRVDRAADRAAAILTTLYLVVFVAGEIVALSALSADKIAWGWLSVFATFLAFGCVLVPVFHHQISVLAQAESAFWRARNFVAVAVPALVGLAGAITVTP